MTPEDEEWLQARKQRRPDRSASPARTAIITLAIAVLSFLVVTWLM